jgi:hypothetical protein
VLAWYAKEEEGSKSKEAEVRRRAGRDLSRRK